MADDKKKPGLFDVKHPMFKKPWIRALFIGVSTVLAVVEYFIDEPIWTVIFGGSALYLFWSFFMSKDKDYFQSEETDEPEK